jgi:hypothetical protein
MTPSAREKKYEQTGRSFSLDSGLARAIVTLYPEEVQPTLLFPSQPELTPEIPPTWCEGSDVYHTTEKCNRLQAIHRNRRIKANKPPVSLRPCFNCEDIIRTKRSG